MHILITGNPVDGFRFTGPFPDHDAAADEGDRTNGDWWLAPITAGEAPATARDEEIARRLAANPVVQSIFIAELANEEAMRREAMSKGRDDEMPPAANLSTVIDSIRQGLPIAVDGTSDEEVEALTALLGIRDLLPGAYEVRNLLVDDDKRPSVPGEFSIVELIEVMSEVLDLSSHVREATAGGTVALWTDLVDGRVVCVTEDPEPFSPDADDVVRPEAFTVGIYGAEEAYMGGQPWTRMLRVLPTMTDLRKALADIVVQP